MEKRTENMVSVEEKVDTEYKSTPRCNKIVLVNIHLLRPRFSTLETTTLEAVYELIFKSFHTKFIEVQKSRCFSKS